MEKEKFGRFVSSLRKELGMTQKDLAERLCLTDKAISKWERGLSFPDISMLEPMAEIFNVTVVELLQGERLQEDVPISMKEAEKIVGESLSISDEEINRKHIQSKTIILICCVAIMFCISLAMNIQNLSERKKETRILKTELDVYQTTKDEKGTEVFINPHDALNQMIKDCQEGEMEGNLTKYLEILENSLEEEMDE